MTPPAFYLVSRGGARLLRALPGWTLSQKETSLYRRIGRADVSIYTKPAKGGTFYVKIEVPIEAEDEAEAVKVASAMAEMAVW